MILSVKNQTLWPDINVICVKAWCAHDNPFGKVVPGTPNRANGIWGRCFLIKGQLSISQKRDAIIRLDSMLFVLLFFAIDKDRLP